jgi:hypothetical protein
VSSLMRKKQITLELDVSYGPGGYVPEHALMTAILERAILDLKPYAQKEWRRQAISWFEHISSTKDKALPIFSFEYVAEYLGLTPTHKRLLRELASTAEKNHG